MSHEPERSAAEELASIAFDLGTWLDWQRTCGAGGLPGDPEMLALLDAGSTPAASPTRPVSAPGASPRPPSAAYPPRTSTGAGGGPARPGERPRVSPGVPVAPDAPAPPPAPRAPELSLQERARRLDVLERRVRDCTQCELSQARTQTVFARGNPTAELCFVGEGPGADEDRLGKPFVGKAGQLLDKMIQAMGYSPDDVYVCNVVKCRPPNNRKPEPAEMAACGAYMTEQLDLVGPKVIVALGATAVQGLLGTSLGITRLRGTWKLYRGRVPVMPTFHPAYLLRQPGAKRQVWDDLQQVMKQLGKPLPSKR